MRWRIAPLVACVALSACGGKSPTAPTPPPSSPPAATHSLTGRVSVASGGAGIASARVEVVSGVNVGQVSTADGDGRYTFASLAAGGMTLRASASGYESQTVSVTLSANQTVDFTLPAAAEPPAGRASLSGRVTGASPGDPVFLPSARVEIISGPNVGHSATADDNGRYRLSDLLPGAASVRATATGYVTQTRTLTLGADETADFSLAAAPSFVTNGHAIDVLTQAAIAGVAPGGDGLRGTPSDASGAFSVIAETNSADPRLVLFTGPGVVGRQTNVRIPGADALISLISSGFDLRAFDEMFRAPLLRRWTSAPPLVVQARAIQFTDVNMSEGTALADAMSDAEVNALVGDLAWALPQLTGGGHRAFASVSRQTAPPGSRVPLLNNGVITVARVVGLSAATGYWGFGRWQHQSDGTVTGGLVMIDHDFDRSGSPFARSLRAHELGHALGYQHVTGRASVMNAAGRIEPNAFDLDACRIAFQRLPGNRSPDIDPDSASLNRRTGGATWSAPIR